MHTMKFIDEVQYKQWIGFSAGIRLDAYLKLAPDAEAIIDVSKADNYKQASERADLAFLFEVDGHCIALAQGRLVDVTTTAVANPEPAPAVHVIDRQAALDRYQESRRRRGAGWAGNGSLRAQGFLAGYDAGVADAQAAKPAPIVSQEAAAALSRKGERPAPISKERVGKLIDAVYHNLKTMGPGTASDVADRLGEPLNTISPRMRTLINQRRAIVSGGTKVGRATRSIYTAV